MNIRHLNIWAAVALTVVTVAACGKRSEPDNTADKSAIDTAQLAPGGSGTQAPDTVAAAPVDTVPVATHLATLETSAGTIELELYGKDAPKTVENFVGLAKKKYYDGVAFHRVVPTFMVQTGDPNSRDLQDRSAWGAGGESIYGGNFADELDATKPSARRGYVTGTVAMANSGPNTNGSQFFIVLSTGGASHLDFKYTIFGMLRSGAEAMKKIEQTGFTGENPENPVILKKVTIKEVAPASGAGADTTTAKSS